VGTEQPLDSETTPSTAVDPAAFYRGMFQHPDIAFFVVRVSSDGRFLCEDGNEPLEKWIGKTIRR
jgi:hypothetical protein